MPDPIDRAIERCALPMLDRRNQPIDGSKFVNRVKLRELLIQVYELGRLDALVHDHEEVEEPPAEKCLLDDLGQLYPETEEGRDDA